MLSQWLLHMSCGHLLLFTVFIFTHAQLVTWLGRPAVEVPFYVVVYCRCFMHVVMVTAPFNILYFITFYGFAVNLQCAEGL